MIRSRWSQVMQQLTRAWSKNLCFWVFCVISDTIWILGPYWKSLFHNARTASPIYREAPLCLFEIWAFKQGHGGIIFLTFRGLKCLPRWWVAKKCPKVFWRFGQQSASFLSSYWKCYWYIFPKMGTFGTVWDDHLQVACPSRWSFASGKILRMIICKRSIPLYDHLQVAGSSR